MNLRRALLYLVKLAFSVGLLWVVVSRTDFHSVLQRLRGVDWRWLLPGALIGPVAVLLSAWRWKKLSLDLIGFGAAVRYTWIGLFFGSVLPGLVGGDLAKGLSLAAKDPRVRDSRLPISIIADKLVGLWVLVLIFACVAVTTLVIQPGLLMDFRRAVYAASFIAIAGLITGLLLSHRQGAAWLNRILPLVPFAPLRRWGEQLARAVGNYAGKGALLGQAAAISVMLHGFNALALWFALRSLGIPASLWFAALFYPLLSGLLALPVSISGVGVRDAFSASMFSLFGLGTESGVAFSWLLLAMSIPNVLFGGAIQGYELFTRETPKKNAALLKPGATA
jgi:glycosyltransferase 2 family protein